MRIQEIAVKNFRCLQDVAVHCDKLTAMLGRNGAGKSTLLHALRLFYQPVSNYSEDDFYSGHTEAPISIRITFTDLTAAERREFQTYLDGDTLTVEKELTWPRGKTSQGYFGWRLQHPHLAPIRQVEKVTEKRSRYTTARATCPDLEELGRAPSDEEIEAAMARYEGAHAGQLERIRDSGRFFGFKEVGNAKLERFTRFVFVPAVRDAAEDAAEGKGSAITDLLDILVRSTLLQKPEIASLKEEMDTKYRQIVSPEGGLPELQLIKDRLARNLHTYVPDANLDLRWNPGDGVSFPHPSASVRLEEDGYRSTVDRVGHGLQRAFIFSILQELPSASRTAAPTVNGESPESGPQNQPSLILAIEEVELYQHPSRQRNMATVMLSLVQAPPPGVESLQVLYTTHSPLFVDLERFDQVRIFRKVPGAGGGPRVSRVRKYTLEELTRAKEHLDGAAAGTYAVAGEVARLRTLMTPWTNEAFFASAVVLVEGEQDRAALLAQARLFSVNLEARDIAVIPCSGKANLAKAALIFRGFGLPTFVLWDGDKDEEDPRPTINRTLLRLHRVAEVDYPLTTVSDDHGCFERTLEQQLRQEVGEDVYRACQDEVRSEFGINRDKEALKNPSIMFRLLQIAQERGRTSGTLAELLERVGALAAMAAAD